MSPQRTIIMAELVDERLTVPAQPMNDFDRLRMECNVKLSQLDPDVLRDRCAQLMAEMAINMRDLRDMCAGLKDVTFKKQAAAYYKSENDATNAFYKFIFTGRV